MYELVKDYRENEVLRLSFNALARKTFGLNFEDWYQNGFWRGNYIPYSMVKDGEVVANVSVNTQDMLMQGEVKHVVQLGTVMTAKEHRNQGLIRNIMAEIEKDFSDKTDGMFLFAGDSVLEFYPKFGFRQAKEYQYSREVNNSGEMTWVQVPMDHANAWAKLENAIQNSTFRGQFDMLNNSELNMFYMTKFMRDTAYYIEGLDTYVIAEPEESSVFIYEVLSDKEITLNDVIATLGSRFKQVTLGFVPCDTTDWECTERKEEDCTFFVKGAAFDQFEERKLMVPTLAHA